MSVNILPGAPEVLVLVAALTDGWDMCLEK